MVDRIVLRVVCLACLGVWPLAIVVGASPPPPPPIQPSDAAATPTSELGAQDSVAAPVDEETIREWIKTLDSDVFAERVRATRLLLQAGPTAIEPLQQALPSGDRESATRGVYILRQLTVQNASDSTRLAASRALDALADSPASVAARAATSARSEIHKLWFKQAQEYLQKRGAIFTNTPIVAQRNVQEIHPSILLGSRWQGTVDDLPRIAWVTWDRTGEPPTQWMLILDGPQIDDTWIAPLASIQGIRVLRLSSSQITNDAVKRIAEMPDLVALEMLYNGVDDQCLDALAANAKFKRLRLVGNRISFEGIERLRQTLAQADIDFRAGGFLGVSCDDNPCRIINVQPNSAAARAGLRLNDVILRYNGQGVKSMDELIRAIAKHGVGEKVAIDLERDGQPITRELVLGKWE